MRHCERPVVVLRRGVHMVGGHVGVWESTAAQHLPPIISTHQIDGHHSSLSGTSTTIENNRLLVAMVSGQEPTCLRGLS